MVRRKLISAIAAGLFVLGAGPLYSFGKNKVDYEDMNWQVLKTIHFDIHYPKGMQGLAEKTAQIAEQGYVHISNYLCHELTDVIPIMVYPSHITFQNNSIIPFILGEGVGGFTEALKNRVVVPYNGLDDKFRHTVIHELVHAFQYNILLNDTSGNLMSKMMTGRVPLWVIEGMAEYVSIGYDETADMVMRDALFNEKYATLLELTYYRVKSGYLLYKEGQAFFYFMELKYGKESMGEFFRDIRDLGDLEQACVIRTGKGLEELNKEWIRFYKKRYMHLVREKNYEDEEGEQVSNHVKTKSSVNMAPAISPDGKRIAYISNKDIYADLVIATVEKKGGREIRRVIRGNVDHRFEGMHILDNNLSWSEDGKSIVFVAQAGGRDVIYYVDPEEGDIQKEIELPFRKIMDPSISKDGKELVFVGSGSLASDIYLYNTEEKKLTRVTNDPFTKRNPKIVPGTPKKIVYSSNETENGKLDDSRIGGRYHIYEIDLKTRQKRILVKSWGNDLQPDVSKDGERMIYISNRTGIYNLYVYIMKTGEEYKVSNVLSGVFQPQWFGAADRVVYTGYQNLGYDIFIKKIDMEGLKPTEDEEKIETEYLEFTYKQGYFDMAQSLYRPYPSDISFDWLTLGIVGDFRNTIMGIARVSLSDLSGNHKMAMTTNYVRNDGSNDFNFDLSYSYLRYRCDLIFGAFRQENPFWIYSITSINDLIHNAYTGTLHMEHYGAYGIARYPFTKFLRMDLKASFSRYERGYEAADSRDDVYANVNQLALALSYDTTLWGMMVPMDGMRGRIEFEQAINLTGHDYVYSTFDVDIRKYFLFYKKYVIALKGAGGRVFGRDSDAFKYYLGGYNTLRGHTFFGYTGKNMFLFNAEFRFPFVKGILFGWPITFGIGEIGGVFFVDVGSAWDGSYDLINSETGAFEDLKADFGFGFRFAIYPLVILKLDFAWPYDKKSVGQGDVLFSLGFEY
ncbi:MAG: BamA/TamA family outer membrane protein [bacterium]|nr:BamA/TamA family outer membrane protein [bacterium]